MQLTITKRTVGIAIIVLVVLFSLFASYKIGTESRFEQYLSHSSFIPKYEADYNKCKIEYNVKRCLLLPIDHDPAGSAYIWVPDHK